MADDPFQKRWVQQIFPSLVWISDLAPDAADALNRDLLRMLETLLKPPPEGLTPGRTNWQTDPILHRLPQFAAFVTLAERAGRDAADYLKLRQRDLVMTGCWANLNPPLGYNPSHIHPNNYLSGVYYVSIPGNEGAISFEDPRSQSQVIMPMVREQTPLNGNMVTFRVKSGRFVLFPAWLPHSVPLNQSEGNRISIAFNLMFQGYVADASAPLWQGSHPVTVPDQAT